MRCGDFTAGLGRAVNHVAAAMSTDTHSFDREVHRLHVGGLPADVDEQELKRRFQPFGDIVAAEVIRATDSGESRGFGYVSLLASEAEVERSIKAYTGTRWRGQKLTVWYAHESYLDRLEREWEEARSECEVAAAAAAENVVAWDRTTSLRVRPSQLVPVITAKPGKTNRHKRKFGVPAVLPPKSNLFTSYEDEPRLVASTASHRLGVRAGEGASESGEEVTSDGSVSRDGSSDGEAAEELHAEGERRVADRGAVVEGPLASAQVAVSTRPKVLKKSTPPAAAAVPRELEDELAEAELFMRGKGKAMHAFRRPVLNAARAGAGVAGSSAPPSHDAKAGAGPGDSSSSGLPGSRDVDAGAGQRGDGAVGSEWVPGHAHLEGDQALEADAAAEAERERDRTASLRVLSELLGQDAGELERDDGRELRAAERKRRWGEWASRDGWQIGAKFDPEADPIGAKFDPEADQPATRIPDSPSASFAGSPANRSRGGGQDVCHEDILTEISMKLPPAQAQAPQRARARAVDVSGAASQDGLRATAAVKKATVKPRPLKQPAGREGSPEPNLPNLKMAGDISAAQREVPGPAEAVLQPRAASLRRVESPASEALAKARRINPPQSSKVEARASGSKAAAAVEPKAAVQSAVRLRGLFVGGGSGDSFALSGLLGYGGVGERSNPATGGATPQGLPAPRCDTLEPGLLFQSIFESARAEARGSEAGGAAVGPMGEAGGLPVAAESAWAAPEMPFMRQESEAELLRSWRRGRSEARHAYKKTHQDAVRQRRKDRAAFKRPAAEKTA